MERSFEPPARVEQVEPERGGRTLYSLQLYSISTVYNLYNTPLLLSLHSLLVLPSLWTMAWRCRPVPL